MEAISFWRVFVVPSPKIAKPSLDLREAGVMEDHISSVVSENLRYRQKTLLLYTIGLRLQLDILHTTTIFADCPKRCRWLSGLNFCVSCYHVRLEAAWGGLRRLSSPRKYHKNNVLFSILCEVSLVSQSTIIIIYFLFSNSIIINPKRPCYKISV